MSPNQFERVKLWHAENVDLNIPYIDLKKRNLLQSEIFNYRAKVIFVAEREGFEPSARYYPYGGLANHWFKPLTHLSVFYYDYI